MPLEVSEWINFDDISFHIGNWFHPLHLHSFETVILKSSNWPTLVKLVGKMVNFVMGSIFRIGRNGIEWVWCKKCPIVHHFDQNWSKWLANLVNFEQSAIFQIGRNGIEWETFYDFDQIWSKWLANLVKFWAWVNLTNWKKWNRMKTVSKWPIFRSSWPKLVKLVTKLVNFEKGSIFRIGRNGIEWDQLPNLAFPTPNPPKIGIQNWWSSSQVKLSNYTTNGIERKWTNYRCNWVDEIEERRDHDGGWIDSSLRDFFLIL